MGASVTRFQHGTGWAGKDRSVRTLFVCLNKENSYFCINNSGSKRVAKVQDIVTVYTEVYSEVVSLPTCPHSNLSALSSVFWLRKEEATEVSCCCSSELKFLSSSCLNQIFYSSMAIESNLQSVESVLVSPLPSSSTHSPRIPSTA